MLVLGFILANVRMTDDAYISSAKSRLRLGVFASPGHLFFEKYKKCYYSQVAESNSMEMYYLCKMKIEATSFK